VDKSLVVVERQGGEARYRLLETMRAYGLDLLKAHGEARPVAARHARYYLALVDEAKHLYTSEGPRSRRGWYARLLPERGNLRAALDWCRDHDPALGLRLAAGLGWFWVVHHDLTDGEGWLERFLAQGPGEPGLRGRALLALATLKRDRGDLAAAQPLLEESLALCRQVGDRWGVARGLAMLAHQARSRADYERGLALTRESLAIARELRVDDSIIWALSALAQLHRLRGESDRARAALEEILRRWPQEHFAIYLLGLIAEDAGDYDRAEALYRAGHERWRPWSTHSIWFGYYRSRVARKRGDLVRARRFLEEDVAISQQIGDPIVCFHLFNLAELDWAEGDPVSGHARLAEGLSVALHQGSRQNLAFGLLVSARYAVDVGELDRAARLFGAADAAVPLFHFEWDGVEFGAYERALDQVGAALTPDALASAWAAGQAMTLEQAIAYALEEDDALG
jgi:tetratricopeptide (TPR) repeat protein